MNDSYFGSTIPWTKFTVKTGVMNFIIQFGYSIWFVGNQAGNLKIVIDAIAFIILLPLLIFRYITPLFTTNLVKVSTLSFEMFRAWATLLAIIYEGLGLYMDSISIIIDIFIGWVLCWIFLTLIRMKL